MSNIQIKTKFGGFPNVSVIDRDDGVLICSNSYPVSTSVAISYDEAADIAQKLMDMVSAHIQKVAA